MHPTEKNHELIKELILDNSNEGDVVMDACAGSGSHLLIAKSEKRKFLGIEKEYQFYKISADRCGLKELVYGEWNKF